MININDILSQEKPADIISALKARTTEAHNWEDLKKEYDPKLHNIINDTSNRKDKIHPDGSKDTAARLSFGLEKLLAEYYNNFTFGIRVKRNYVNVDETNKEISSIIEKIYKNAHIDSLNKKRGIAYYSSCEVLTVWYVKKLDKPHHMYGFPCNFKLKCKTYSPMDGVKLYPLIDEYDEMHAMSLEYRKKVKDTWVSYFETYTADKHYKWSCVEDGKWEQVSEPSEISIGKIPCVYIYRKAPVWDGLCQLREDLEYSISRNSDVIAYNSAPILKVAGSIIGEENKGETRRVYRVTEGGDVSYVSWAQSIAALEYHARTLVNLFFMQGHMPNISFENMRSLGNIGYDARKLLFTDAHMKIEDEACDWIESFERECNVIKAFLKQLNVKLSHDAIDSLEVEHIITPYVQEDEMHEIDKWNKASGGAPLVGPLEVIRMAGLSKDAEKTMAEIVTYSTAQKPAQNEGS